MALDHYIPQVHLKNFYAPELGKLLYAFRKSDGDEYTPNSKSICRTDEGNTNEYLESPRAVEEFLKDIEPNYNKSVNALSSDNFGEDEIYVISGFLSYVMTCSPTAMRMGTIMLEETIKEEARILDKQGLFDKPPKELEGKSVTELIDSGILKVDVDGKFPQAIGVSNIVDRIFQIGNFRWEILINNHEDAPFFTSDFPIAPETAMVTGAVMKTIPLSPKLAVKIIPHLAPSENYKPDNFKDFEYRIRNINRAEAVHINRLLVRSAEETVFSSCNQNWVRKFIQRNKSYQTTTKVRIIKTPDGKLFWYHHCICPRISK